MTTLGVKKGEMIGIHLPNISQYPIMLVLVSKISAIAKGISPLLAPLEVVYQI
jgi:long-chain acyl-CoA synthetase